MTALRERTLLAFKKLLEQKPFDEKGVRTEIIGSMFKLFGENPDEIEKGMVELGENLKTLGMILSSYPGNPEILCAMQESPVA